MPPAAVTFTTQDAAKYPFLSPAADYVRRQGFRIQDLEDPELVEVLRRGQERIKESLSQLQIKRDLAHEPVEILSYPVAIILASATGSSFVKRRYALAEAKQAEKDLREETRERILEFAQDFRLNLALVEDHVPPFEFRVRFADYLRNTTYLKGKKWKLVNRIVSNGYIYITHNEAIRLLGEEIQRRVEKRIEEADRPELSAGMLKVVEEIRGLAAGKSFKKESTVYPRVIKEGAFPPCLSLLYEGVLSGRPMSHIERFTLASFLAKIGMTSQQIIGLFENSSDYNEKMTRYQVEHIAGERGSREKYSPPLCSTLKTHGVCRNPDAFCRNVRSPLRYYHKKHSTIKKKPE